MKTPLVREIDSNAIINTNKSDYEKFLKIFLEKYQEKEEYDDLKSDVKSLKDDMSEIKSLLKSVWINRL